MAEGTRVRRRLLAGQHDGIWPEDRAQIGPGDRRVPRARLRIGAAQVKATVGRLADPEDGGQILVEELRLFTLGVALPND